MDLSLSLRFQYSSVLCLSSRELCSPIKLPLKQSIPFSSSRKTTQQRRFSVTAKVGDKSIEGVSRHLNSIACQHLDNAAARRGVRSAFIEVQQQLDHPLFKMAPAGIRTQEWYEMNSKGLEIFVKSWFPEQGTETKGVLCYSHGYGDTCTFFFEGIARQLAARGYVVYGIDHPGFGLSDGLHGYVPSFDALVDNLIEQYTKIKGKDEIKGLPCFLLGQSMGGAVAIKALLKEPNAWDGLMLVAPMCRVAEELKPPPPVLKALTCLSKFLPKAKLFPQKDLSELAFRCVKKRKMAKYNVVCYKDQLRLKTAVELLKATDEIEAQVEKVSSPLLILHGAADKVTDPLISQFMYENSSSKDKTLKLYEGGYHCILEGEPDDRIFTVLDDMVAWLDARSNQQVQTQSWPSSTTSPSSSVVLSIFKR